MDDTQYPVIEGLETFVVFLSSAQGAEMTKPFQAVIAINDTFQDGKLWGNAVGGPDYFSVFFFTHSHFHSRNCMFVCVHACTCMCTLLHRNMGKKSSFMFLVLC